MKSNEHPPPSNNQQQLIKTNNKPQSIPLCSYCRHESDPQFICSCNARYYCTLRCKKKDFSFHYKKCPRKCIDVSTITRNAESQYGIVGLENQSNMCYINTTLQCLSCYWEFANYFLTDRYLSQLNVKASSVVVDELQGPISRTFSNVVKQLMYGTSKLIDPWNFQYVLFNSQTMFEYGKQQDSQEFLMFLLDTLHEELNRVKDKPQNMYSDNDNNNDNTLNDKEYSQSEWNKYLSSNQSLIVDLFYGQFKSEIMYNECQHVSKKFELFTCLSLPISPQDKFYYMKCVFMFYNANSRKLYLPIPFIHINNSIMSFRKKISRLLNIHPMGFFVLMYNHKTKVYQYQSVKDKIIVSYEQYENLYDNVTYYVIQINPTLFNDYVSNKYETSNKSFIEHLRNAFNYQALFTNELEEVNAHSNSTMNKQLNDALKVGKNGTYYDCSYYYPSIYNTNPSLHTMIPFGKVYVDNYYGFNPNKFIHIPCYIINKDNPRVDDNMLLHFILTFKLRTSTAEVHKQLFQYLFNLLNSIDSNIQGKTNFNVHFPKINQIIYTNPDKLEIPSANEITRKHPYIVFINKEMNLYLPYDKTISIGDVFKLYNKKYQLSTSDFTNDNSYYFLSQQQRELIHNKNNNFSLYIVSNIDKQDKTLYNKFNLIEKIGTSNITIPSLLQQPQQQQKQQQQQQETPVIYLEDLLFKFSKWEEFDSLTCQVCQLKRKAKKRIEVFKCPYYLIIQLKRFTYKKDLSLIKFPLCDLDMSKYSWYKDESGLPMLYDLVAVMNHIGSLNKGHFFAFSKNIKTKEWFKFDDEKYERLNDEKDIVKETAYVLFYRRKDFEKYFDMDEQYGKKVEKEKVKMEEEDKKQSKTKVEEDKKQSKIKEIKEEVKEELKEDKGEEEKSINDPGQSFRLF